MSIQKICFIADGYPSEYRVVNAFVETLVNAMTDLGMSCTVIAPQSLSKALKLHTKILPSKRIRYTTSGQPVTVYTPKYISASVRRIGPFNTAWITLLNFRHSAQRVFHKLQLTERFDAVYGHFIFESGITANYIGKRWNTPAFFAYGENTTYSIDYLGTMSTKRLLAGMLGVISVSSENKRVLIENDIADENVIGVFPNAVDHTLFYPRDKISMRVKYGFPKDGFIIAFVGRLLEVKGSARLSRAIEQMQDDNVYSLFIGEGPEKPTCERVLFEGTVNHTLVGEYLSAADIFVLPTLAEGCCNAIVEAMACGLPVISSNMAFNSDILDDSCAILIDPNDVGGLAIAIQNLKEDEALRRRLASGAFKRAATLTIENRASAIWRFMETCIEKAEHSNDYTN